MFKAILLAYFFLKLIESTNYPKSKCSRLSSLLLLKVDPIYKLSSEIKMFKVILFAYFFLNLIQSTNFHPKSSVQGYPLCLLLPKVDRPFVCAFAGLRFA